MMPILYLLGGFAQCAVAVLAGKIAWGEWRNDLASAVLAAIVAALFILCAFLLFIQVQP